MSLTFWEIPYILEKLFSYKSKNDMWKNPAKQKTLNESLIIVEKSIQKFDNI